MPKTIYSREELMELRTDGGPDAAPASPEARIFDVWLPCVAKASYSYLANTVERPNFFARGSSSGSGTMASPSPSSGLYVPPTSTPAGAAAPATTPTAPAPPTMWRYRSRGGTNVSNAMQFSEIAELVADDLIDEANTEVARDGEDVFVPFAEAKANPNGVAAATSAQGPSTEAAPPAATTAAAEPEPTPGRYVPRRQATHNFPGPNVLHATANVPPPANATARFVPSEQLRGIRPSRYAGGAEWSRENMQTAKQEPLVTTPPASGTTTPPPPTDSPSRSRGATPQTNSPALRPATPPVTVDEPAPAWRSALAGLSPAGTAQSPEGALTAEGLENELKKKAVTPSSTVPPSSIDASLSSPEVQTPSPATTEPNLEDSHNEQTPEKKGGKYANKKNANTNKGGKANRVDPTVTTGPPAPRSKNPKAAARTPGTSPPPTPSPQPSSSLATSATVSRSETPQADNTPPQPKKDNKRKQRGAAAAPAAEAAAPTPAAAEAPPPAAPAPKPKRGNRRSSEPTPPPAEAPAAPAPQEPTPAPPAPKERRGKYQKEKGHKESPAATPPAEAPAPSQQDAAPPPPPAPTTTAPPKNNRRGNKDKHKDSAWGAVAPTPVVDMQTVMQEAATSPKQLYPSKPAGWRSVVGGGGSHVQPNALPTLDDVSSPPKKK